MMPTPLHILIVGAHVDDHWYGMGGTMLKATRSGHKVTVIQAVSNYCSWPVVTNREADITPHVTRITRDTGVQVIPLGHDYLRLTPQPALIGQLAAHIADLQPDIVFCPWEDDTNSNQDHSAVGTAARIAAIHAPCFVDPKRAPFKLPQQVLHYSLGDTNRFTPTHYVDIGETMFDMLELNNVWDEIYVKHPAWPQDALRRLTLTDHLNSDRRITLNYESEIILGRCLTHGTQAHTRFAEAFIAHKHAPAHKDLLAQL